MHLRVLGASRFEVRQLGGLLIVGGAAALPASPPGAALIQSTGIERATAQQDGFQRLLVCGRWHQLVLVGFAHAVLLHTYLFSPLGRTVETTQDVRSPKS